MASTLAAPPAIVSAAASSVQVPLSGVTFPFRTQLGALSRLQVSGQGVLAQKDGTAAMLVTTADVLNGQVNSGGGLLHSMTVSKPATLATTLLQCRTLSGGEERVAGAAPKSAAAGPTLLKARKAAPSPVSSSAAGRTLVKNHHQQPTLAQGLALPELLAAPQVPLPPAASQQQQLPNGMPTTVLGQSKLFPVSNHSAVQGVLDGTAYHQAQLVAKGARNGSRSHPGGRAVLPDATSAVVAAAGGVSAAASLPASMAKQQLYQQVLAGQVQAQLIPPTLKLPLLLPNDERRHRPPQAPQLKVPGGSLPT